MWCMCKLFVRHNLPFQFYVLFAKEKHIRNELSTLDWYLHFPKSCVWAKNSYLKSLIYVLSMNEGKYRITNILAKLSSNLCRCHFTIVLSEKIELCWSKTISHIYVWFLKQHFTCETEKILARHQKHTSEVLF